MTVYEEMYLFYIHFIFSSIFFHFISKYFSLKISEVVHHDLEQRLSTFHRTEDESPPKESLRFQGGIGTTDCQIQTAGIMIFLQTTI